MTGRSRTAFTLVEILVAAAAGALVLAVAMYAWTGGLKSGKAAQSAAAATGIALFRTALAEDLAQLVVDPGLRSAVLIQGEGVYFLVGSFTRGRPGPVRARTVEYAAEPSPRGNRLVRRIDGASSRVLPGIVFERGLRFTVVEYPSGQFLRAEGNLLDADEAAVGPAVAGPRATPMVLVLAIPIPKNVGHPGLARAMPPPVREAQPR